ncbi:MAG: PAS domain S-box protein [Chloroflexia bacterium]
MLADHEVYLAAISRLFTAVDAGDMALVTSLDSEVEIKFNGIQQRVRTASEIHDNATTASQDKLNSTENFFVFLTPIVFGFGLILLVIFWSIQSGYQRNVAQSQLREATAELERTKSSAEAEQKAFRESSEHFRALVQNSTDIIMVVDLQGVLHYNSPSFERVIGQSTDNDAKTNIFQLF